MTPAISITGLTRRFRDQFALDDVSLDLEAGSITGLLGRNGAGKTTLLRILAGQEFPSTGSAQVLGADPAENEAVLRRTVFVREDQTYPDFAVRHALRAASWWYPNWDAELADELQAAFELPAGRAIKKLSRGMRSALGITIGLGLLFDTLVVRAFMTPSIAALLGRWFWWPQQVRPRPASALLRPLEPRPLVRSLLLRQ